MTDQSLVGEPVATTRAPAQDTLYGSLVRASDGVPGTKRALAGLRNGDEWVELSYDELMTDVTTVSNHLHSLGLRRGDVLCLLLPNWTEAAIYTYAASRLGAIVCPITTIYRQRELSFILRRTECQIIVVPSVYRGFDYAAMVSEMAGELPDLQHIICVGGTATQNVLSSREVLGSTSAHVEPPATSVDDIAVLAFTSGTTGESKGVMHSHASMHAAIDDFVGHAGYGTGLTSLVMSPFGHLTGFTWGILMPLRGAGDVVLLEMWNPSEALDLVARYSVTFTMGATPFLSDILDAADSRPGAAFPDVFICAGAPIPPSLIDRAVRSHDCRVVSGWGMSEYPIGTSTSVGDDSLLASACDGRPAGRAEILIVDHSGHPLEVGQEGDLLIRGPGLFRGYYKRPDLDAEAFTPDGRLKTGDRARVLDPRGHIRICGRTKDIIIRGGENIPVVEIENILLTHPAIKEIALVPLPHERLGEIACACIVVSNDDSADPTVADLAEFLGTHGVAKQFYPESVRVMPGFARTPSGKIQKFLLREQVLSQAPDTDG